MKVVIIDYGAGNIRSAERALHVVGDDIPNFSLTVSHKPEDIAAADRIILPGDGSYPDCRNALAHSGLEQALTEAVINRAVPFLGICVGMQLLSTIGLEYERVQGLGWIGGTVQRMQLPDLKLKVPHMGWNTLVQHQPHALLEGIPTSRSDVHEQREARSEGGRGGESPQKDNGLHAFFLHSFHFVVDDPQHIVASTEYGMPLTAIVAKNNIAGVQFHPEKSQKLGLALLSNFLKWTP